MLQNIPEELKILKQWVIAGADKNLFNPRTKRQASVTDLRTWGTFEEAIAAKATHIGFVLTEKDPYSFIDLDNHTNNPASEEEIKRHHKILNAFDSYTELSASGRGYHIIIKGKVPRGVNRDKVEICSDSRYMICTGDIQGGRTIIKEYQELLDILYEEMQPAPVARLSETEESVSDRELVEMAMNAINGDKFNSLCQGIQVGYQSQSEADFALLAIIAYYTKSNEQVRRIFRMSALGKRDKAIRNDTYLNFALGKIRGQQPPDIDLSELIKNAESALNQKGTETVNIPAYENNGHQPNGDNTGLHNQPPKQNIIPYIFPPGLVGDLANYFMQTAIRPVPEIALLAAIAITAGVAGRAYNISGAGLNQYLILLAKTGSGKEGAQAGIDNLVAAVRPRLPMIDQFIGPAAFASGQALIKVLNEKPCFVSVLGEFGVTLHQISDYRAHSSEKMLKKVLLDLYAKSGWNKMLRSSVYSDTEKNTKIVHAPAVTIFGESNPDTFYDGLDVSHISEGLIPRFSIVEYTGKRPARNKHPNVPPTDNLAQHFSDLVASSLTISNGNNVVEVQMDRASQYLMDSFDHMADKMINEESNHKVAIELWNRAHLKALKLAALLAVGVNHINPVVTEDLALWAVEFIRQEISGVTKRFMTGDIGLGDSKQHIDLKKAIEVYLEKKDIKGVFCRNGIIPYQFLVRRLASNPSYRMDKIGATQALKRNIQSFIDSGMLVQIAPQVILEKYKSTGICYGVGSNW